MNKIIVSEIWEADNGDIFLKKVSDYLDHTTDEINSMYIEAKKMYESGNVKKCTYQQNKAYGSYYNGDVFLGNEQIHILTEYSKAQDYIYLVYKGKIKNNIWKQVKLWEKIK